MKFLVARTREWLGLSGSVGKEAAGAAKRGARHAGMALAQPDLSNPSQSGLLRRSLSWRGMAAAAGLALSMGAQAAYPDKPVQVIISFPPAGATDVLARAVGQRLSTELGQSVVVDNKPGAGGAIGLMAGARAAPNGYVLYLAATTNQAIAAAIYKDQQAHLAKDFEPIGLIGYVPHALVVPASLPVKSVAELIDYIKAAPGEYNYASQGVGTLSHLEGELFTARYGLKITHIPYKGSVQALPDVANGTATMMFDSVTGSMPLAKGGKLRYLAVAAPARVALLPDVPTLGEAGIENVIPDNRFGLFAPKGTPPDILETVSAALKRALADPDLQASLATQSVQLMYAPGPDLQKVVEDEHEYWAGVVKSANVTAK